MILHYSHRCSSATATILPPRCFSTGTPSQCQHLEEDQLVLVELSGVINPDFLSKCENKCKILGIDTERPIMQIHMKENSDPSYEHEKPLNLEMEDSGPIIEIPSFDIEGFVLIEIQDAGLEATPRRNISHNI
ncbi:uncharacterized protein ACDL77_012361 [Rhynchocyon petersi]